jgi:hypothetical protein
VDDPADPAGSSCRLPRFERHRRSLAENGDIDLTEPDRTRVHAGLVILAHDLRRTPSRTAGRPGRERREAGDAPATGRPVRAAVDPGSAGDARRHLTAHRHDQPGHSSPAGLPVATRAKPAVTPSPGTPNPGAWKPRRHSARQPGSGRVYPRIDYGPPVAPTSGPSTPTSGPRVPPAPSTSRPRHRSDRDGRPCPA